MDTKKLIKTEGPIWKQSPSIRRDIKKATASIKSKLKILKYTFPFILLSLVSDEIQAQNLQHQNFNYGHNKQAPLQQTKHLPKQNIIFDEVGKLASNLKYIHVAIPLNITTFYEGRSVVEWFSTLVVCTKGPRFKSRCRHWRKRNKRNKSPFTFFRIVSYILSALTCLWTRIRTSMAYLAPSME